jgi:hypothetical protein
MANKKMWNWMDKMEGKTEGTSWANMNKERVRQGYKKLTTKNYKRLKDETYKDMEIKFYYDGNEVVAQIYAFPIFGRGKTKKEAFSKIKNEINFHIYRGSFRMYGIYHKDNKKR